MRFFVRLLSRYKAQVNDRPIFTQIVTCGTLVAAGDVIAQTVVERKAEFDFRRAAVMSVCGFSYFGPIVGAWFTALNRWGLPAVACVGLDQFALVPPLLSGFFTLQSLLSGKSLSSSLERVRTELPSVLVVNWTVWIPVQCANFWFIPFQYRMLYVQSIALFWNCYLSYKANHGTQNSKVLPADE